MARSTGARRALLIGIALILAMVGMGFGLVNWLFDPARLTAKLSDVVSRSTGLTMTVSGKAGIEFSLTPTISMADVSLVYPGDHTGFSRPELVKVARVEVTLALLPLFQRQIEIQHVALSRPDILFETNSAGLDNWRRPRVAAPAAGSGPPVAPGQAPASGGAEFAISAQDVVITDGLVTWANDASGQRGSLDVPRLTLAVPAEGSARAAGTVRFEGETIAVTTQNLPLQDLRAANGDQPWPVALTLTAEGAALTIEGKIDRPLEGRGYHLALDGTFPDLRFLPASLRDGPVEALRDMTLHAELNDGESGAPAITAIGLKAKSIDLAGLAHGWKLEDPSLGARGTAPMRVVARLSRPGLDTGLTGEVGDLAWLSHGASGPLRVALDWNAASARGSVKGMIQAPSRLSGYALTVTIDVPDPVLVMEGAPPGVKAVSFYASLSDTAGLTPFQLTSSAGDLSGELSVVLKPRLSVKGHVGSQNLNLDAFRLPPPSGQAPSSAPAAPEAPGKPAPVIPAGTLPIEQLRSVDADLTFALARVKLDGNDITGIDAKLSLKDGLLRVDPFTAATPETHATLLADFSKTPPAVHLTLTASAVPVEPLLTGLGFPPVATGTAEIRADLTGAGDSLHAIASTLDGWSGIALAGGQLDARTINGWLDRLRPSRSEGDKGADLRCFAVRADVKAGTATIHDGALNSAPLIAEGGGEVDLAHETLSLGLRPRMRVGGTEVVLPVRLTGPWRNPSVKADLSPASLGASGLMGLVLGAADTLHLTDPCPAALARARDAVPPAPDMLHRLLGGQK